MASPALAAPETGTPGPETLGDPVLPSLGNDGHRVRAYHLDLAYDATTRLVDATAPLSITPTQDLSRFSLDPLGESLGTARERAGGPPGLDAMSGAGPTPAG